MTNTTFSIQLQGILLPDDVRERLESQLRSVVLSEIAKTDLGQEISVRPLPASPERIFSHGNPILGFIAQKLTQLTQRSAADSGPSTLFTPPFDLDRLKEVLGLLQGPATTSLQPFADAPPTDVIQALYYRPDIRSATISNGRALAELLSRDEKAMQVFNELTGGSTNLTSGTERITPLLFAAIMVTAAYAGVVLGVWSRPQ